MKPLSLLSVPPYSYILFPIIVFAFVFLFYIYVKRHAADFRRTQQQNRAEAKGELGERIVAHKLGATIVGEQYVINNVMFRTNAGQTCQIDHIFINQYGVWVIETKNYAGMIYGDECRREWLQVLAYGKAKNKFYNPIKQNATHIYHLCEKLHTKYGFHSIIVFSDEADLSHVEASNVFHISNLSNLKHIKTDINLSPEEMQKRYEAILSLKEESDVTLIEHVDNIHHMQSNIRQGICPRCGKELVIRNGKNGQFYGCNGYPNCKFTKKID